MVRLVASVGLLLTGCFYVDPIVQRPAVFIDVVQPQGGQQLFRGAAVELVARYEPAHPEGTYAWSAFACSGMERGVGVNCSASSFGTGNQATWTFDVPEFVGVPGMPVQAILVKLEARDDRGALAQGGVETFAVADAAPTLELRKAAHSFTVGAPIELFARYGDPDDPAGGTALTWRVFTPATQPAYLLEDLEVRQDPNDTAHVTAGKRFVAQGTGDWDVEVTARDALGQSIERHIAVAVAADRPPCLAQSQPIVPPAGAALPVIDPTVFQVSLVDDDLDAYPPVLGDAVFGTTAFAWSILAPGEARRPLVGATGNAIDFDPGAFTPGDVVELRVEIFDRNRIAIPCPDSAAACSVIAQPSCLQRQTWRVEVR